MLTVIIRHHERPQISDKMAVVGRPDHAAGAGVQRPEQATQATRIIIITDEAAESETASIITSQLILEVEKRRPLWDH